MKTPGRAKGPCAHHDQEANVAENMSGTFIEQESDCYGCERNSVAGRPGFLHIWPRILVTYATGSVHYITRVASYHRGGRSGVFRHVTLN